MLLFVHMLVVRHVSVLIAILCSIGIDFITIALVLPVGFFLDATNDSHFDIQGKLRVFLVFVLEHYFVL